MLSAIQSSINSAIISGGGGSLNTSSTANLLLASATQGQQAVLSSLDILQEDGSSVSLESLLAAQLTLSPESNLLGALNDPSGYSALSGQNLLEAAYGNSADIEV